MEDQPEYDPGLVVSEESPDTKAKKKTQHLKKRVAAPPVLAPDAGKKKSKSREMKEIAAGGALEGARKARGSVALVVSAEKEKKDKDEEDEDEDDVCWTTTRSRGRS